MKSILILGVGNRILGDDGIGSIIAERFEKYSNDFIDIIDVGSSLYKFLSSLTLEDELPREIIIIDIMEGKNPGNIHFLELRNINKGFMSSHLFPDNSLLDDISKRGVKIKFLLCEIGKYEKFFSDKLSENGNLCIKKLEDFIINYIKSIKS